MHHPRKCDILKEVIAFSKLYSVLGLINANKGTRDRPPDCRRRKNNVWEAPALRKESDLVGKADVATISDAMA